MPQAEALAQVAIVPYLRVAEVQRALLLAGQPALALAAVTQERGMRPDLHLDLNQVDLSRVIADREAIRRVNPQRFEMEQLTAIVYLDPVQHVIVGYKDVQPDEYWVRGHLPGHPLMPGVLMCEAAAQLCSYYTITQKIMACDFIGFGGMENVRFRATVRPGDRLVLVAKGNRMNRRQMICNVQGFVGSTMVFHADVVGVPLTLKVEA